MWSVTPFETIVYILLQDILGNSLSKMKSKITRIKFLISAFDCRKRKKIDSTH
jgi:hypothetical protein